MSLNWETRTGYFKGLKANSTAYPPHTDDGSFSFYRIKIARNQRRDVLAFAPDLKGGMKICDTIDEAKQWCEDHENARIELTKSQQ